MKTYKTSIYDMFIESWTEQLKMYTLSLELTYNTDHTVYGGKKRKYAIVRALKNQVKRCKWNITRAKNLKKLEDQ